MRPKVLFASAALAAVLLAGCGGDDSSKSSSAAGGASTTTAASSGNGGSSSGTSGGSSSTVTAKPAQDSGAAGDAFCANGTKLADAFDKATSGTGTSATDMKSTYQQLDSFFKQLASTAPKEIKADFQTWSDAWSKLSATLAKYDYDMTKMVSDPQALDAFKSLDDPKLEQASANIEAWVQKNCPALASK